MCSNWFAYGLRRNLPLFYSFLQSLVFQTKTQLLDFISWKSEVNLVKLIKFSIKDHILQWFFYIFIFFIIFCCGISCNDIWMSKKTKLEIDFWRNAGEEKYKISISRRWSVAKLGDWSSYEWWSTIQKCPNQTKSTQDQAKIARRTPIAKVDVAHDVVVLMAHTATNTSCTSKIVTLW